MLCLDLTQDLEDANSVLKGPADDVCSCPGGVATHHPPTLMCKRELPTKDGGVPLPT